MMSVLSRGEFPVSMTVLIPLVVASKKEKRLRRSPGAIRLGKPTSWLVPALSVMTPRRLAVAISSSIYCPVVTISLGL